MKDKFVGLKYKVKLPNSLFAESFEQRWDEFTGKTPSQIKAVAGSDFHLRYVLSVCVFDETGFVHLYLRKNPFTLECEVREVN
jgi:hypothetical protein